MSPAVFRQVSARGSCLMSVVLFACSLLRRLLQKNADVIIRHNRIRTLVSKMGNAFCLVLEKRGILGDSKKPGRRPGDVTFPCWQDSKGLAVDVCPFSARTFTPRVPL